MSNWFYYDQQGQKIGPITDSELRELIVRGLILPDTKLETDTGHSVKARQVPGLFAEVSQSEPAGTQKAEAYCTNCGHPVEEQAAACMKCGVSPVGHNKFCRRCGVRLNPEQVLCVKCGTSVAASGGVPGACGAQSVGGQVRDSQNGEAADVPDYLVLAILETLFCCVPCGVIAIVYAVGANSAAENGNHALGQKKARTAKYWLIAGVAVFVLLYLAYGKDLAYGMLYILWVIGKGV
ncbi:MAG: CD225/dispanin family protein [Thermoguttaceae bacterium]|nr:CD225/dispanin family protein [Thermoguttaceae bacterium]MBQ6619477.1 CD225/dispanin family protein [Thermoguttaceae bacterium]